MGAGVSKNELVNYAKTNQLADYAKTNQLVDYVRKIELNNYLKSTDANTTFVKGSELDTKVSGLGYTKQKDLNITGLDMNTLATTLSTNAGLLNNLKVNPDLAKTIATQSDTSFKSNIANSLKNDSTFQSSLRASMLSDKDPITGLSKFAGPSGEINEITANAIMRPKTLWCADGKLCEVPDTTQRVLLRPQVIGSVATFPKRDDAQVLDFIGGVERDTETGKNGNKLGPMDGIIRAVINNDANTEEKARESSLEVYGIGKAYDNSSKRLRRQVKIFDDLTVGNTNGPTSLKIGNHELVSDGDDLFVKKGTATIAKFSGRTTGDNHAISDRFSVYQDLKTDGPYWYINGNGRFGKGPGEQRMYIDNFTEIKHGAHIRGQLTSDDTIIATNGNIKMGEHGWIGYNSGRGVLTMDDLRVSGHTPVALNPNGWGQIN